MSIDKSKSESKIVINQYRSLMRIINGDINLNEKKMIRSAFNLAIKAHSSRRKSGELFITHPISVAKIVAQDIGLGPTSIICSLLHDVVEDTEISSE